MDLIKSHRELKVYQKAFRFIGMQYLSPEKHRILDDEYDNIIGMLVNMQKHPESWTI